jgi:hypothetical protein
MTKRDLYHIQRIVGYDQVGRVQYSGNTVIYQLDPQPKMIKCRCCGSTDVISPGIENRVIRGVPAIGTQFIHFNVSIPMFECRYCGTVRQIDPGTAEPKERYSKAFAKADVMLVFITSMNSAAALSRVSAGT